MDHKSLRVTQNAHFSLLTETKQLLELKFCDHTAGIVKLDWTPTDAVRTDRLEGCNSYVDELFNLPTPSLQRREPVESKESGEF